MYKAMCDRIDTISVMDLLKEIEVLAVVNPVQQDREDQRSCTYCGQKSHGKSPDINLRKADCPAHGKKCAKCHQKGHYAGVITRRGDKKTTAGTNHANLGPSKHQKDVVLETPDGGDASEKHDEGDISEQSDVRDASEAPDEGDASKTPDEGDDQEAHYEGIAPEPPDEGMLPRHLRRGRIPRHMWGDVS
jgi:hypothetical protein